MTPRTCRKAVFLSPFSSQFAEFNQITPIPSEKWKPFLSNKWTRYRKYRLVIPFFTLSSGCFLYAHILSSKVHLLTNPFFDIRLVVSPTELNQVPPKSNSGISSWRLAMSNVAEYVKTVTYLFKILSPMSLPLCLSFQHFFKHLQFSKMTFHHYFPLPSEQ